MSFDDKAGLSKTAIDRLGDRLRQDQPEEADLRVLDEFRRSFGAAYDVVVSTLRDDLGLQPTGRPAKSTASIREKLRRETIRLSQIQDIAGCRVVVDSMQAQDAMMSALNAAFPRVHCIDRRENPSNGYRAVHAIAWHEGSAVEIQIRTSLQHKWAELSEKLADVLDPAIKYGGGPAEARRLLAVNASAIANLESWEVDLEQSKRKLEELASTPEARQLAEYGDAVATHQRVRSEHEKMRQKYFDVLTDNIRQIEAL